MKTSRGAYQPLPIEVRRQLWRTLWRDHLLRPRSQADETNGQHPAGTGAPVGQVCPRDTGRVAD
jgi:hypothetical protein